MSRGPLVPESLVLLAWLKLRGSWRRQWRRLKSPSGILFALLGILLMGSWAAIFLIARAGRGGLGAGGVLEFESARLGCLVLTLVTTFGSLNHRGLYLPAEEIGRLFSGPFRRSDLIRYRLLNHVGRSLYAGVIFGLLTLGRFERPFFGFVGALLVLATLAVFGQAVSILVGGAEGRAQGILSSTRFRSMSRLVTVGLVFSMVAYFFVIGTGQVTKFEFSFDADSPVRRALGVAARPFLPWANLVTATSWSTFGLWLSVCTVFFAALFELTARIPIDYRELSLDTSADVARRLRRSAGRGHGASSSKVSTRGRLRRVPWLFGHGAFGSVAWLKTASIVRKARGTLFVSVAIVAMLTFVFGAMSDLGGADPLVAPILIGLLASIYLCGALRFDFRMDLDRMSTIKAWPLASRWIFLANLLPEILLISLLAGIAVLVRGALDSSITPFLLCVVAGLPLISGLWVVTDNAVFLFSPVRPTPGQDGALQHTGRSLLLLALRMLLLGVQLGITTGMVMLVKLGCARLGWTGGVSQVLQAAAAFCSLAGLFFVAIGVGGRILKRFDVARDRG